MAETSFGGYARPKKGQKGVLQGTRTKISSTLRIDPAVTHTSDFLSLAL